MISKIIGIINLILVCAFAQEKVVLFDFEPRGVDSATVKLSTQLLRDALNNTLKYVVMEPTPGTQCYTVIPAAEEARKIGASKAVIGSITQLGSMRLISFQLIDAASATVDFGDKVEAPTIEEFPTCFDRVATALIERKTFRSTLEPEKVTGPETGPRYKHARQPYASLFMTAGYLFPMGDRGILYGPGNSLFNLNLAISFETPGMLSLAQLGMLRGRYDEFDLAFDLQINKIIGTSDFAPYAGLGCGVTRFTWIDPDIGERKSDGFNVSANVGLLGFRSYYFRLLAQGGVTMTFANEPDWERLPGFRVGFGLTTPSFGPGADIETTQGCVSMAIVAFFITGLVAALVK
jgi:hypothetical protein